MTDELTLVLVAPEVMGVRASQQPIDDPHLNWYVDYAPERDEDTGARVVFANLHAAGANGIADVTIACMMRYPLEREPGTDEFASVLASSDALETLWDIARVAFRSIAAVAGVNVEVPDKAPDAEISQLVPSDSSDNSMDEGTAVADSAE